MHEALGCPQHLTSQQGDHTCNPSTQGVEAGDQRSPVTPALRGWRQETSSRSLLAKQEFKPVFKKGVAVVWKFIKPCVCVCVCVGEN